jgi:hypothetical protein
MRTLLGLMVIGLLVAAPASAQTIVFDNMPGDDYNPGTGHTISGASSPVGSDFDQGDQFMPSASGNLSDVWVAMGHVTGLNEFELWLTDDAGGTPGTTLWSSGAIKDLMGPFGSLNPPVHISVDGGPMLTAGSSYWLLASVADDTWAAWNWNNIGDEGLHASRQNMGGWGVGDGTRGAFRIAVPEPTTLMLLLGGLPLIRRRR